MDLNHLQLYQFKDRQECHNDLRPAPSAFEEVVKRDVIFCAERFKNEGYLVAHRYPFSKNFMGRFFRQLRNYLLKCLNQVKKCNPFQVNTLLLFFRIRLFRKCLSDKDIPVEHISLIKGESGLFDILIFKELFNKVSPGVFLFLFSLFGNRKQHPGFDMQEGRCHKQKLPCHIKVKGLHDLDVIQILPGYISNRDVIDIYLGFLYQMKEEVERTFKGL